MTDLDPAQRDAAQLASLRTEWTIYLDTRRVKREFEAVGFDVAGVLSGATYTVRLASWPTRTLHGQQVPISTQAAIENRVRKAGYSLRRYSDMQGDMFLVVE